MELVRDRQGGGLLPPSQREGGYTLPEGLDLASLKGADAAYIAGSAGPVTDFGGAEIITDVSKPEGNQVFSLATQALPVIGGGGALSGILTALGISGGLAGTIGTVASIGMGLYGAWQALGGGEGEGLFGLDILGGDTPDTGGKMTTGLGNYVDGVPLGGPGLAEPPAAWIEKEWTTVQGGTKCQYYLVRMPTGPRRVVMYNFRTKRYKSWPLRKSSAAYIGKKLPSHKMIVRLRRNLGKHSADARTILKITSPASLATSSRSSGRSRHRR